MVWRQFAIRSQATPVPVEAPGSEEVFKIMVAIPGTINGFPVTSIGDSAFSNGLRLGSITLAEGVTRKNGRNALGLGNVLLSIAVKQPCGARATLKPERLS